MKKDQILFFLLCIVFFPLVKTVPAEKNAKHFINNTILQSKPIENLILPLHILLTKDSSRLLRSINFTRARYLMIHLLHVVIHQVAILLKKVLIMHKAFNSEKRYSSKTKFYCISFQLLANIINT